MHAEALGVPFALSGICLLQYLLHLHNRYGQANLEAQLLSDLQKLEGAMNSLQRERLLARQENIILRDIFQGASSGKAMEILLKKLVQSSAEGFALFLHQEFGQYSVLRQRGLTPKSAGQVRLSPQWLTRLRQERQLRLAGAELASSELLASLTPHERRKITELHLFAVFDRDEMFAVIATTHLFPLGMEVATQQALVRHVLDGISGLLRQSLQLVDQQHLLKLTQEKLALRGIADRDHETPGKLLDEYLSRLAILVEADRGTLLLATQNAVTPYRVISRQGSTLFSGLNEVWQQHELTLAGWARNLKTPASLSVSDLAEIGIDSLMGSAIVLPLKQQDRSLGIMCLARRDQGLFTSMQINLAGWAADFLSQTLLRLLDRLEVERQASLDGLTELANRRTFDARIQRELELSRVHGTECSLALFDLDYFKKVNDTFGHQAGDEILRRFARLLEKESSKVRATDVPLVARYGGEEMAVLFPGMGLTGALRVTELIRQATEQSRIHYQQQLIPITVSVGVSSFPRYAQSTEELIQSADRALYLAKHSGRNAVRSSLDVQSNSTFNSTGMEIGVNLA